jgi:hypothetical protein
VRERRPLCRDSLGTAWRHYRKVFMTPIETVKPCPSKKKKPPKAFGLVAVINFFSKLVRLLKLVDTVWDWSKNHWTSVWDLIKSLGHLL